MKRLEKMRLGLRNGWTWEDKARGDVLPLPKLVNPRKYENIIWSITSNNFIMHNLNLI